MPVELSAVKYTASDEMEAYERLLTDAMKGDQLLFVRQDAVEAHGRSSIRSWATAVRCETMSRERGARRTRASWRPTSAAGTIRSRESADSRTGDKRIACDDEPQRLIDGCLDPDARGHGDSFRPITVVGDPQVGASAGEVLAVVARRE